MRAGRVFHARGRGLKASVAGSAVLALGLVAGVGGAGPALAALGHTGHGVEITGVTSYGTTWLGPVIGTADAEVSGWYSWCITAGYDAPEGAGAIATGYVDDPQLAWIVQAKEGEARNDASGLAAAAISYLMHTRHETGTASVPAAARIAAFEANTPTFIKDRAALWLAEAAAQAGPYSPGSTSVDGAGTRTGAIYIDPVTGPGGQAIVGKPMEVTLNGPAVFDLNGNGQVDLGETTVWTGTTPAERTRLPWVATGNGEVTWEGHYGGLPRTTLTKLSASGQVQDTLTYGLRAPSDPEEISVPGTPFDVVFDMEVRATTTVQSTEVQAGDPLVDQVTYSTPGGQPWVSIGGRPLDVVSEVTWYGPFDTPQPQQATVPAGAPVVGTEQVVADGPGTVSSPGTVTAPGHGFYTAVVSITKTMQGKDAVYLRKDFRAPFFEESETTVDRWEISHSSQAREFNVAPGGRAFDSITVGGMPASHTDFEGLGKHVADVDDATVTVYGPLEALPSTVEVPAGTPQLWSDTIASKNGRYEIGYDTSNPIVTPKVSTFPGGDYYVFVYSFPGDARVEPYTSAFNDVLEAFYVPGNPEVVVPPTVVTQATKDAATGQPFGDTALVTGTTEPGDHLVFRAYGPQDPTDPPVCDESTLAWTSPEVPVDGAGYYEVTGATVTAPGVVYWIEQLLDQDGTVKHTGKCGVPSETTTVTSDLAVTTTAQADGVLVHGQDAELWDVAHISGYVPEGATVEFDLYAWADATTPVCTPDTLVAHLDPIPAAAGDVTSEKVTVPAVELASYGWVQTTRSQDGTVLATGECGEAAETLRAVSAPMTVTTKASVVDGDGKTIQDPTAGDGGLATDTQIVTGTVPAGTKGRSIAYADTNGDGAWTEDEKVWTSDWITYDEGLADATEYPVPGGYAYAGVSGAITFAEETVDADGNRIHYEAPGNPAQTVSVKPVAAGDTAKAAADSASALAVTGAQAGAIAAAALALLVAGVAAVVLRRRAARSLPTSGTDTP